MTDTITPIADPRSLIGNSLHWEPFDCDRWRAERVRDAAGLSATHYTAGAGRPELVPPSFLSAQYVDAYALGIPDAPARLNGGNSCLWLEYARVGDRLERCSSIVDARRKYGASGLLDIYTIETVYRRRDGGPLVAKLSYTAIRRYPPVLGVPEIPSTRVPEPVPDGATRILTARPTPRDVVRYAAATEDLYEAHYDADYARAHGFSGPIVHGLLKMAWFARAALELAGRDHIVRELSVSYRGIDLVRDEFTVWAQGIGTMASDVRLRLYGGSSAVGVTTVGEAVVET